VNGLPEHDTAAARIALGEKFPKLPFHKIVCFGALIAQRSEAGWQVRSLGARSLGERTEAELVQGFVDLVDLHRPSMVTFNGSSFDLPVLRYRAMINRIRCLDRAS
jgi:3'-5' exonuclease